MAYVKKTDKVYDTSKTFLARCRKATKLSATAMANTMGCSLTNLYDIEQKPLDRTLFALKKYCAVLGLNWKDVLECLDFEFCSPSDSKTSNLYLMVNGKVVYAKEEKPNKE